ncbi:MAG: hypothetical protein KKA79_00025 [Nanoarchaeota archaeon]|nr:hypothetical protein [Nanoarchaeota archaeon]
MTFISGYNVVLKEMDIPEGFKKISIIQFLRNIKDGKPFPEKAAVVGLDILLSASENSRENVKYIMSKLRIGNKIFREKNMVFVFIPQKGLYENSDVYCKSGDKKVSISDIFASRLQIRDDGLYHAEFEF